MKQSLYMLIIFVLASTVSSNTNQSNAFFLNDNFSSFDTTRYILYHNAIYDAANQNGRLTSLSSNQRGRIYLRQPFWMDNFNVQFDFYMGGGSGGDGMVFAFTTSHNYAGQAGEWLDFDGATGYGIVLNTFQNSGDPSEECIGLVHNGPKNYLAYWVAPNNALEGGNWRTVRVSNELGHIRVWLDDTIRIDYQIANYQPFTGYFGFTASSGSATNYHRVDNLTIMEGAHHAPELAFAPGDGFIDDGVYPDSGRTLTEYEFRTVYSDADNNPPMTGYPKVNIDINGDGTIDTLTDITATMWPVDGDTAYSDGREYYFRTYLPESATIQYSFEAKDANGLDAESDPGPLGWNTGPLVSNDLVDLEIHASDITFSNPHPDPYDPVTVYASVMNNSPGPLTDVLAYLYIGNELVDSAVVETVSPGYSPNLFQFTYAFPGDDFYSIRVVIDPLNTTGGYNSLNNGAARGLVVGNYVFSGGIDLNLSVPETAVCGQATPFQFEAHYYGLGFVDSLPVAGATVTFRVVETGGSAKTTYSNDYGLGGDRFIAPQDTGHYTLEVTLTDYTLSRTERAYFAVTCPCHDDKFSVTNLNINLCGADKTNQPFRSSSQICLNATINNFDNNNSYSNVGWAAYLDGTVIGGVHYIPTLAPGTSVSLTGISLPGSFAIGLHTVSLRVDPFNTEVDCRPYNNSASDVFRVWPDSELVATGASVSPSHPTVYDNLTLRLTAANTGYFDLGPVEANFVSVSNDSMLGSATVSSITARGGEYTFSLTVPHLPQGTYTVRMTIDPNHAITEYEETNNVRTITFSVDSLFPNFQVVPSQFGLDNPDQTTPGSNSLYAVVSNTGSEDASGVVVRFYEGDIPVGSDQVVDLPAGTGKTARVDYYVDLNCHKLSVRVDPDNAFLEQNEQDNYVSGTVPYEVVVDHLPLCPGILVPLPMFSACEVHVPEGAQAPLTVWTRIRNTGLLSTPSFTPMLTDNFYDPDRSYALSAITLEPGHDILLHQDILFDTGDRGAHTFTVSADNIGGATECNISNNVYSVTVTVDTTARRPDLVVDVSLNRTCTPISESAIAKVVVTNQGKDTSDAAWVRLLRGVTIIDSAIVPDLIPGEHVTPFDNYGVQFPGLGLTSVSAIVDPTNLVEESDDFNNSGISSINVVSDLIDVALTGVVASDYTPDTTQVVKLTAYVKNLGGAPLTQPLIVAFRPNDRDTALYDTIFDLGACRDENTAAVNYVFRDTGHLCVDVTADDPNLITESDTANNFGTVCVNVHALKPDLEISASDIQYTNSNPQQGDPVFIDVIVHNLGPIDVPSASVQVFIGGTKIGGDISVSVPSGGSQTARTTVTWAADRLTPQTIQAVVDPGNLVEELDENNNEAEICAVPDIEFHHTSGCPEWNSPRPVFTRCPANVDVPFNVRAFLINIGAMDISSETWVKYYDLFASDTTLFDSVSFDNLSAHGGTVDLSVAQLYPTNVFAGTHTIIMAVDETGTLIQCEAPDISAYDIVVDTLIRDHVDLMTRSEYVDISNVHPDVGDYVNISATIYNQGPDSAVGFGVRFLIDEQPLGNDIFIPGLSPAGGSNDHITVAAPATWEATNLPTPLHVAHVIIDPLDAIRETDEDNDEATRAIVVGDIADLALSLVSSLPSDNDCLAIDSTTQLTVQVENQGLLDASSDLLVRQIVPGGDTLLIDSRPLFVRSLSNQFEDFEISINADSVYLLFELANPEPQDYIPENDTLTVSWSRCCCEGMRGNVDNDPSDAVDIGDLVYLVEYSFSGGPASLCQQESDVNGDNALDIADLVYLVEYSFGNGPAPVACP